VLEITSVQGKPVSVLVASFYVHVINNNMYSIQETDWPRQCTRCKDGGWTVRGLNSAEARFSALL